MLHVKGTEIGKDRVKVTSLVIAKEHVIFSHAWLGSQKIIARGSYEQMLRYLRCASGLPIFISFLQKPSSLAKVSEHFFTTFSQSVFSIQARYGYRVTCSFTVIYDVICHDPLQFTFLSHAKVIPVRPTWEVKGAGLPKANLQTCFQRVGGEPALPGYYIN